MIRRSPALLAIALLSACATPQFDPPRIAEIDRIVERYQARSTAPGFAVGVIDGKKVSVLGYGRISKNSQEEPRGDTVYEIGSITKVFSSFILADLAQDGVVKLNDPIQLHLPPNVTAPRRSDQEILLSHLATHQSGLPRLPPNLPHSDDPYANYGVDRLYDFLNAHRLRREVGKNYEYSNLGMGLLGTLLERAAGMPFEQLVVSRIAEPLKMRDTRITLTDAMKARFAPPHDHKGKPSHNWHFQALAGAGALRSTVDDLLKFAAANLGQGSPRMTGVLASCHAVRQEVVPDRLRVGLAWHLSPLRTGSQRWATWHNGATGGYASFLGFVKETGTAVVVLSNATLAPTHDARSECDQIGFEILELLNP